MVTKSLRKADWMPIPVTLLRLRISWHTISICVFLALFPVAEVLAQTATLSGIVTDSTTGEPLELANIRLSEETTFLRGTTTNRDGLYLMPRIPSGRYTVVVSSIGYARSAHTLTLDSGEIRTLNIALSPDEVFLDEVLIQAEGESDAASVTAGQQTIQPEEIELIPSPSLSADLATYLATVPGFVATGDRGGQLFVRGGEPSQNLVLLDGMILHQPFHVLGFYSAFPSDIISQTDLYAGGFGSKYGGRISSVLDVRSRNGNSRRFVGAVALSPFLGSARIEGPLLPGRFSMLVSARESLAEQGAQRLIGEDLPFRFGDLFGKIHGRITERSRVSVTGIRTHDRGTLAEDLGGAPPEEVRWENLAGGVRYLALPRILPVIVDAHLSFSRLNTELGPQGEPTRSSSVETTRLSLDATFLGERVDVETGFAAEFYTLASELGGLYQNVETQATSLDQLALYTELEFDTGKGLRIRPGLRLQFNEVQFEPFLEPRLRVVWERGIHQISGAAGLYHQEIIGLSDRRDAASVFTAWTNIPKSDLDPKDVRGGRVPRAMHAILGYRGTPAPWLAFSIEGFYKRLSNLFISEWTAFPRFTTRLQPAHGRSFGFEGRLELRRRAFYSYVNYGLSSSLYEAEQAALELWYGVETLRFRPPHDRRHQVNVLISTSLKGFDLSARWEFGSGLPFNRPLGFDGFVLLEDFVDVLEEPGTHRVIYERPYNGLLPTYHRLDASIERTLTLGAADVTIQGSLINVYDRRNLFYLDVFTFRRVDQLPFVPSIGLKIGFE